MSAVKKKSIGLNAVVNSVKTIVNIIFPLITYPYISRVLGVESLGRYNFANSIVHYFYLFAGLGIATYSIREGTRYREDRDAFSDFASEIFSINFLSMTLSLVLLAAVTVLSPKINGYREIVAVLSLTILLHTLGCEWIFSIYEEYLYMAIRSILVHVMALVLMFLLVRTEQDVVWYAAAVVISQTGANLFNIVRLRKFARIRLTFRPSMLAHLLPILILFANSLATTIYVNSDVTILGFLKSDYEVGLYTISSKVYAIVKQILSAVIIVSVPRLSFLWGQGKKESFNKLATEILQALSVLVLPATVGLFCLRRQVILLISTEKFIGAASSLGILSVALIFSLFSWFYTSCILIPTGNEKRVLTATVAAACLNVGLNFLLIPLWGENAAALTTVLAEACNLAICMLRSKHVTRIRPGLREAASVLCGCAFIFIFCELVTRNLSGLFLTTAVCIAGSSAGYAAILWLLKNETIRRMAANVKKKLA